jgi:hypothetical protein
MNLIEASQKFERFRRKSWAIKDFYYYWSKGCLHKCGKHSSPDKVFFITQENLIADDWIEYEEPHCSFDEARNKFLKFKRASWSGKHHLEFSAALGFLCKISYSGEEVNVILSRHDLNSNDWIEYRG